MQSPQQSASGMAVISVLLIVALIAGLASALMTRQTAVLHKVQNEQHRIRNYWVLRGEISRAQATLQQITHGQPVVRLDGTWNRPALARPITLDNGQPARLYSQITDEQSKYNLSNVVDRGQIQPKEVQVFLRLCALLDVPSSQAQLIIQRVMAGLLQAQPNPENPLDQAQQAAVQAIREQLQLSNLASAPRLRVLHDLSAVPGIQPATLTRLAPYVTILPERTWINANTASAVVIAAWVPGLSLEKAQALLHSRDQGTWFINHGDIIQRLNMPELAAHDILLGITSSWFHLHSMIQNSQGISQVQALLHHDIRRQHTQLIWLREGV